MKQTFSQYVDALVEQFFDLPWQKQVFVGFATAILVAGIVQGVATWLLQ
jgi:hypothetical protein